MKIFFSDSLCRRCPYGEFTRCLYKKQFYENVPPPSSNLKLIHKCSFYRTIFKKGQLVVIDLYHQVPDGQGRWEYVVAHRDVCGWIAGVRGSKYLVDLFEPRFLQRKHKVRLFLRASQPAKMIRPFDYGRYHLERVQGIRVDKSLFSAVCN